MELVKFIQKAFGKKCSICITEISVTKLDKLDLCQNCFENVKKLESEEPAKITKEQIAGGIKDEL